MPCKGDGAGSTNRASRRPGRRRRQVVLLWGPGRVILRAEAQLALHRWRLLKAPQSRLRVPHMTRPPPRLIMRTPIFSNPAFRHASSVQDKGYVR